MSSCSETQSESCGFNSECLEEVCACSWGHFISQDFILESDNRDCLGNKAALLFLYSLQLVCVLLAAFIYLRHVSRFSQIKRLLPFFFGLVCYFIMSIIKFTDIEGRFYGEDAAITIIYALTFPASNISSHVILKKHINLMYRLLPLKPDTKESTLRRQERMIFASSCLSVVAAILFISTLCVKNERSIQILFRCSFGIMVLTSLIFGVSDFSFGSKMSTDLSKLASVDEKAMIMMERASKVKWALFSGLIGFMLLYIVGASSFKGLEFYAYCAPLQGIVSGIDSIAVVYFNSGSLANRSTKRPNQGSKTTNANNSMATLQNNQVTHRFNQSHRLDLDSI